MKYESTKNHFKRIKKMDKNIREVLKDKDEDIILTFYMDISMSVLRNKNYLKNSKIVVTEHIDYFRCSTKGRFIRNYTHRKADYII